MPTIKINPEKALKYLKQGYEIWVKGYDINEPDLSTPLSIEDFDGDGDKEIVEYFSEKEALELWCDNVKCFSIEERIGIRADEIKNVEDIEGFFLALVSTEELSFHPDDSFLGYINDLGQPCYTQEECLYLDGLMAKSFEICEHYNADIYEIGMKVLSTTNPFFQ